MQKLISPCLISLLATIVWAKSEIRFPDGFKIGVGTAAYQVEGAWNVSDKGMSIWDEFTHRIPSPISDGSNGDVACDQYHKYKEDVAILKNLGVDFYRFSLSWSRILPTGFANNVSQDGIRYYKNLLDALDAAGIEPVVTIYHFDLPLVLEELGGWTNASIVTWYADYARVVFEQLGDRIKVFSTINEPYIYCKAAYGFGTLAPGKKDMKRSPYLCVHYMLKAHAKAYKIYDSEFRKAQGGEIGIVLMCSYFHPKYRNDTESADVTHAFDCGWAANPIFSKEGDYPAVMKERVAENSKLEGLPRSRLPEFTQAEINEIRGSSDYFGLNHYTTLLTESDPKTEKTSTGQLYPDAGVIVSLDPKWPKRPNWLFGVVPQGLRDMLIKVKKLYNNPKIYVMESGASFNESTADDYQKIQYLHDYLQQLLMAVNYDGCNVKRYSVWSFMDNFQWESGYTDRFGLVSVDFDDPSRPRSPKLSYSWFQELLRTRKIPSLRGDKFVPYSSKSSFATGKKDMKRSPYLCVHNMLKAHAKAYKIYDAEFRKTQGGEIGIVLLCNYFYPKYRNDTESADVGHAFDCGWAANPIFSKEGDYPAVMKERIAESSKLDGLPRSRLPEFTQTEINEIRGSSDYFGLNHYTSFLTESAPKEEKISTELFFQDSDVIVSWDPKWPRTTDRLISVVPEGFRDMLNKVKKLYNNPKIYVMENGASFNESTTDDYQRIQYLHDYLQQLLMAVNYDGCNVQRYCVWSFMDNFQWHMGYTEGYGLMSVDFDDPSRPRSPKFSYSWFQELLRTRKIPSLRGDKFVPYSSKSSFATGLPVVVAIQFAIVAKFLYW